MYAPISMEDLYVIATWITSSALMEEHVLSLVIQVSVVHIYILTIADECASHTNTCENSCVTTDSIP